MNQTFQRPPGFVYSSAKEGRAGPAVLRCEKISLPTLADRFNTPLYVYSASAIRERVGAFAHAFRNVEHTICYSIKANSNLSILRLLGKLGCGFDVVSGGELAFQDRKAQSFVLTPDFCGSKATGYGPTPVGSNARNLQLGRAMTISGAAAKLAGIPSC